MGAQQIYSSKKQADGLKKSAVAGDPDAQLVLGNILLGSITFFDMEPRGRGPGNPASRPLFPADWV